MANVDDGSVGVAQTVVDPGGGSNTKPDGTVENGGIWYHGALYSNPGQLASQFGSDDLWREFLNNNSAFHDWNYHYALDHPNGPPGGGPTGGTNPGGTNTGGGSTGKADGTVENGGIWFHSKWYSTPSDLRTNWSSDDDWRTFLNSNTVFRDWNHQYAVDHPDNTSGTGKGTGGGQTTTGSSPIATAPDWSALLTQYGLPADVVDHLNDIWRQTKGDVQQATPLAMAYLRGTDWYKKTYPGITDGLNNGLFSDERAYRAYKTSVNQIYQQYFGRDATTAELTGYISKGWTNGYVQNHLQGQSLQGTLSDPLKSLFSVDELKAFTDEQAGIDTPLGQKITAQVDLYGKVAPLFQNFYNRGVTREELDALTKNGTQPGQVAQQFKELGYLDAISPVLKNLFSPGELQQMAAEASGADTQQGKQLLDMAQLASSLNQVYTVHYGSQVTRAELNDAYQKGYTAEFVNKQLESGEFAGQLPENVKNLFTPEELQQAGGQATGASSSAQGARLLNLLRDAGGYASTATQYGKQFTRQQLENFYDTGFSANDYGNQLSGEAFAQANKDQIERASGSFGEGELTDDQLAKLGAQRAGLDTPEGARLLAGFNKAQQRMAGAFAGSLARFQLRQQQDLPSDVGA